MHASIHPSIHLSVNVSLRKSCHGAAQAINPLCGSSPSSRLSPHPSQRGSREQQRHSHPRASKFQGIFYAPLLWTPLILLGSVLRAPSLYFTIIMYVLGSKLGTHRKTLGNWEFTEHPWPCVWARDKYILYERIVEMDLPKGSPDFCKI